MYSMDNFIKKYMHLLTLIIITIGIIVWVWQWVKNSKTDDLANTENEIHDPITSIEEPESNIPEYQKLVVFSWSLWPDQDELSIDHYPKFKINNANISDIEMYITVEPIDRIKTYWYFSSSSYFFAFRFFVGEAWMWGYYNVFRNDSNGVSNDTKLWLNGAVPWKYLVWWYERRIPLNQTVPIAKNSWQYWYTYINMENYLLSNVWKDLAIWWYLSSIKEFPGGGRQITNITKIIITYKGSPWSISLIE